MTDLSIQGLASRNLLVSASVCINQPETFNLGLRSDTPSALFVTPPTSSLQKEGDDGLGRVSILPGGSLPTAIECGKRGMTYQPSRRKRVNSHGLEKRLITPSGRLTLVRRIQGKKRAKLTVDCFV